jgi:hypothetical protein
LEKFLMHYDETTGEIKGFYLASIHGENIPSPCIEIDAEKHRFYMENNGLYKININTLEDELLPILEPTPQPPTEQEKLKADIDYLLMLAGE